MQNKYPEHKLVTDIGSGLNFKRKGLQTILERAFNEEIDQVVIAYKDRLSRFAFELVKWVLEKHKVELVVLNETMGSETEELSNDLLSIIHVFSCRINGKRRYSKKRKAANNGLEEDTNQDNGTRSSDDGEVEVEF